jgi:TonB family protein
MHSTLALSRDPQKSTVILVVLCIHFCLGYLLFCLQSSQKACEPAVVIMADEAPVHTTTTTLIPQKKNPEWGEMLARRGNFGIPAASPTYAVQHKETAPESAQKSSPHALTQAKKSIIQDAVIEPQTPTTLESIASDKQISDQQISDQQVNNNESAPHHDGTECTATHPQSMPFSPKQKPLTLADIGQGFLAESRHNGTYGVTMEGKKGGHITDEQIKIERYVERLTWCLQNSLRIQRSNIEALTRSEMSVYVFLELERSGTIRHLELIKSSGSSQLDQQTLAIFKDASSSFPPVPTYLTITPFAINYHVQYGTTSETPLRLSFSH